MSETLLTIANLAFAIAAVAGAFVAGWRRGSRRSSDAPSEAIADESAVEPDVTEPASIDEPVPYVSVTTVAGALWSGVQVRELRDDRGHLVAVQLEAALLHAAGAPPTPADGPVLIEAEQIHFRQIVPPPALLGSPPADR